MSNLSAPRVPPADPTAERAILGAILLSPDSLDQVQQAGIGADAFADPAHRAIYECFQELARDDVEVDVVTASSRLDQTNKLQLVGGYNYLSSLQGAVPSLTNLTHYIDVVRDLALKRGLLDALSQVGNRVFEEDDVAVAHLSIAEDALMKLREGNAQNDLVPVSSIAEGVYDMLRQRAESPSTVTGIASGFRDLDKMTAGLHKTDLIIVAARPSMGKTAFTLNLLTHASLREQASTAFFSLEMGKEQLVTRMLGSESRVPGDRLRTGTLRNDDWGPLLQATERLCNAKMYIDDTPAITVPEMRAKCRRLANSRVGLDLVAVDYLQLMQSDDKSLSREQEISSISRGLKGLAKELQVPVIALSQLNRSVESRADKRPMMSDLRESGAIEQDADIIAFLYRDEYYNPGNPETQGIGEVLIRKQRNGAVGDCKLAWRGEYARFENLETRL